MRRRQRLRCMLGVAGVLLGGGLTWWWACSPSPRITKETYDQICDSASTVSEMEAIIGAPPGNYGGGALSAYGDGECWSNSEWTFQMFSNWYGNPALAAQLTGIPVEPKKGRFIAWAGPHGAIGVQLDDDDCIVGAHFGEFPPEHPWWARLLHRVGIR